MKKYILIIVSFFAIALPVAAQQTIKGIVYEETDNTPLPGATVSVEGTTNGTITSLDGKFELQNVKQGNVIIVSFIGHESEKVTITNQTTLKVVLKMKANQLDEVVAVGYGTARKSDLTGSTVSMRTEDLIKVASSNFDQALTGRLAGVSVTSADGTPGDALQIVIRGGNSITGDNSPLYVIDGMPLDDFDPATLSTNDIKSLDVLKDASATAIYGSRGANGVIVITTKSGRTDGKTDVSVSASNRVDWIPNRLEVLDPYNYVKLQEDIAYATDGYQIGTNVRGFENKWVDPELYRDVKGTSWQDKIFRLANTQNYKLSISGGNKTTNFYYSGEYLKQDGTLLNTGFNKIINSVKLNHKISDKTSVNANLRFSYLNRTGVRITGSSYNSVIRDAIRFRPVEPIIDDGLAEGGYDPDDSNFRFYFNPLHSLKNTDRANRSNVLRGGVNLTHKFTKALHLKVSGNYQVDNRKEHIFYGKETQQGTIGNDKINGQIRQRYYQTLSSSSVLTYNKKIKSHRFTALVGIEAQKKDSEYNSLKNSQLPTDLLGINNLGIGTSPGLPITSASGSTLLSYFERVNYNINQRYLITATMRADGSSKFKNDPWGYFPSFSAAWRISEEEFAKKLTWLSNAKLRTGWGLTGNNRIGDFDSWNQLNASLSSGYITGNGEKYTPGVYQSNMGVPDLRWETTEQLNTGLDFALFNNRIDITMDYYRKHTRDLLLNADMALHTGFDRVKQNIGEVENQGFEFILNTVNVDVKGKFTWRTSFNIAFNRNKTIALNKGQNDLKTDPNWDSGFSEYQYITEIGQPVGMMYGLEFDRIYQNSDFNWDIASNSFALKEGVPDNGAKVIAPGSVMFIDQNGDGTVNDLDRVIIGNPHPKHTGGITNSFEFLNGFDCQVQFTWAYGFDILNANNAQFRSGKGVYNGFDNVADLWTPYNTNTTTQAVVYNSVFGSPPKGNQVDNRFIEDGSYLKLNAVTLGYSIPKKLLQKANISRCRIHVSASNLYTWTKYSGYDPNVSVGRYGALTPRLDYAAYPQSSTVMAGIDLSF